jgi:hypothetical protein
MRQRIIGEKKKVKFGDWKTIFTVSCRMISRLGCMLQESKYEKGREKNPAPGNRGFAEHGKSSTSGHEALNNVFFPMQANPHVMFFGFYDFSSQIAEIYAKRMANNLFFFPRKCHVIFFFIHNLHITHLQAVFNLTARISRIRTDRRVKYALVKTN